MTRIHRTAALAVLAVAATAAPAVALDDDAPYESLITSADGLPDGAQIEVRGGDDELVLENRSDRDVVVLGYDDEPYVRIAADGTVAVNDDSPATYLNTVRDGRVTVPDDADGRGEPRWRTLDRSGRFAWFDHRIHWMADTRPPQVTDTSQRTEVFDWTVPVDVEGRETPVTVAGSLVWAPGDDDGVPVAVVVGAVVLLAAGIGAALHRRRRPGATEGATS